MRSKETKKQQTSKLDGSAILKQFLAFEDYWRLMVLLVTLGLLAGTVYYVFARPTYSSTSIIRVNQYFDSARAAQGAAKEVNYLRMRALMDQLSSGYMILEAGRDLGFANENTTYLQLKAGMVPAVRVGLLDQAHIELTVVGFDQRLVEEFPQSVLRVFEEQKAQLRTEFREKAILRYMDELKVVREKVTSQLDDRLRFEEDSALANAQIELEKLSNVPVEIVRTRYRLEEMERIREVLRDQGAELGVTGQLALLTSMADDQGDTLSSGRIVRRTGDARTAPVGFESPETSKEFTQVVVQPEMVESLQPWRELEREKRTLEERIRQIRSKFLEDHPEVRKLNEELETVVAALDLELEVAGSTFDLELERLKSRVVELETKVPEYHKATKNYDQKRLDYELLQKGQLAWDSAYEQLSRQIEGLQFAADDGALDLEFRGFTNLRNDIPVSPSKSKLAMMGLLLGLGMAGGFPFLLKKLDSSVSDLSEFEESLGIPGIGLIPLSDPAELEEVNRAPAIGARVPNALLENFRLIRSSILLNESPKGEAKVVMLTSARPGEGKTTISSNVAWAFASMGDRTLLIDCDLRRGRVHQIAGLSNDQGLTDFLTGGMEAEACIHPSEAANLWVLPRGKVVAGTTELLNTAIFGNLLESLRGKYDRIILDTPPVLGLSETAFLQNHSEGVVLVVRSNRTRRQDVVDAFGALEKLGAHFYGFVLNGVDFSKRANVYQYYYYSASYYDSNWEVEEEVVKEKKSSSSVSAEKVTSSNHG